MAAISAALAAGHDAGPDTSRRWKAAMTTGVLYLFLAAGSGITVLGIGGAFWALVVGVILRLVLVRRASG